MGKKKKITHNSKGVTKQYILKYALRFDWENEYQIREMLIKRYPDVFSHKTKLATIRHYHLDPLEKDGKILSRINRLGEKEWRKKPIGIEEFESDEDEMITFRES